MLVANIRNLFFLNFMERGCIHREICDENVTGSVDYPKYNLW
jgi:hypothetical protein